MKPFFLLFGGKHKLAHRLGSPQRDHVIEPFAGSAGYSVFWEPRRVTLVERDPVIAGIWQFLKRSSAKDIMRLPVDIDTIDDIPRRICQEAKWLVGFWFNHGNAQPAISRSNWARQPRHRASFWSDTIRLRLAHQVSQIRHWRIIEGDWRDAPDVSGHWHVDPPYTMAGKLYRYSNVDYAALADWCLSRKGYVQVCENAGADWLPFEEYAALSDRHRTGVAAEAVFETENDGSPKVSDASATSEIVHFTNRIKRRQKANGMGI
jgi:hypothetical protein